MDFQEICIELILDNPKLINLKKVGVGREAEFFNGFQSIICKLLQLYFARHFQQRDGKIIDSFHEKRSIEDNNKASYKEKITWDIHGKCTSEILEKDIDYATDSDDFHAKFLSGTTLAKTLSWIL